MLDASVVGPWFSAADGARERAARAYHVEHARGSRRAVVPSLLFLEIINVAGRRWGRDVEALIALATRLEALALEVVDPAMTHVARWVGRGLTAYDATYVALAEERATVLVTDDRQILKAAGALARPLS